MLDQSQTLPLVGDYLNAKNQRRRLIPPQDIDEPRILPSNFITAYCLITYEPEFSQIRGLHRKRVILAYFQVNMITKFYKSSKKHCIFGHS